MDDTLKSTLLFTILINIFFIAICHAQPQNSHFKDVADLFNMEQKADFFTVGLDGLYYHNTANMLVAHLNQRNNRASQENVFRPGYGPGFELLGIYHKDIYTPYIMWRHYKKTSTGEDSNGTVFPNTFLSFDSQFDVLDLGLYSRFNQINYIVHDFRFGLRLADLKEDWRESQDGADFRLSDASDNKAIGAYFGINFYQPLISTLSANLAFNAFVLDMKSTLTTGNTSRIVGTNNSTTVQYNAVPGMDLNVGAKYVIKTSSGFLNLGVSWSTMFFGASFFQGASMSWSGAQFGFRYFEKV